MFFGVAMCVAIVFAVALGICGRMRRPIPEILAIVVTICVAVVGVAVAYEIAAEWHER
jgi:hypothetical protein